MKPARQPKEWDSLTNAISETIARNLTAALEVAGGSKNEVKKMYLAELHRRTNISKSTLFKLINGDAGVGKLGRPDLETLCGLAWALNLSPAMLLMSSKDWKLLTAAIDGLPSAMNSPSLDELETATTDIDLASIGLKLAEKIGIYPDKIHAPWEGDDEWEGRLEMVKEVSETNEKKRVSILATTAIAQRGATAKVIELRTAIGAIFGANFNTN
jgi:transcriptional regulator with XRE-family HTH domain